MHQSVVRMLIDRIRPSDTVVDGCCGKCGQADGMLAVERLTKLPVRSRTAHRSRNAQQRGSCRDSQ